MVDSQNWLAPISLALVLGAEEGAGAKAMMKLKFHLQLKQHLL